jgi:hypothetical protein
MLRREFPIMARLLQQVRLPLTPPFEHEIDFCWISRLSNTPEADLLDRMADCDSEPMWNSALKSAPALGVISVE